MKRGSINLNHEARQIADAELKRMFTTPDGLVVCGVCFVRPFVTIHEIVPRSLAPDRKLDNDNRVPICAPCHEYVTELGVESADEVRRAKAYSLYVLDHWKGRADDKTNHE